MHRLFSSNRSINVSNLDDSWVWEGVGECAVAQTLKNLIFFAVTNSIEYTLCYFSPIPLQRFVSFFFSCVWGIFLLSFYSHHFLCCIRDRPLSIARGRGRVGDLMVFRGVEGGSVVTNRILEGGPQKSECFF